MTGLLRLLDYAKPYRSKVYLSIISNILLSIFTVISIPLVIPFFQILFNQSPVLVNSPSGYNPGEWLEYGFSYLIINTDRTQALLYVCAAIIMVFFLKNIFRYLSLFFMAPVRNGLVRDLRSKLFHTYTFLPLSFFNDARKGDLISRATLDVQEIEWSILNVVEALFKAPLIIIGSIVLMIYISPELTAFVFVLIIFTTLIIGGIGRTLKRSSSEAQSQLGRITSFLEETLSGIKVVKAFNAQSYLHGNFDLHNTQYMKIINRILRRRDLSSPMTEFLGVTVVVVLLYYGSTLVFQESLDPEYFFAFIFAFYQVIEPSKSFSSAYYNIQKGIAAMDRVEEMFDIEVDNSNSHGRPLQTFRNSILFENVDFAYPNTAELVLKNINIEIIKGEKIAIVGASGSGKTTLVDLMLGFYQPTQGTISIDGHNISGIQKESLSQLFGLVTQSPILFNDSVRSNISFGTKANKMTVEEAARISYAEEFISQLPEGFNTNIGDSGVKLSGGQRQRLTLARAILRDPPILVLDEATSALDSESEALVQLALDDILKDRTAIIIAHRLSTIKNVDRIIVVKDGEINEIGTHEELSKIDGEYNKFVSMQNFLA